MAKCGLGRAIGATWKHVRSGAERVIGLCIAEFDDCTEVTGMQTIDRDHLFAAYDAELP